MLVAAQQFYHESLHAVLGTGAIQVAKILVEGGTCSSSTGRMHRRSDLVLPIICKRIALMASVGFGRRPKQKPTARNSAAVGLVFL